MFPFADVQAVGYQPEGGDWIETSTGVYTRTFTFPVTISYYDITFVNLDDNVRAPDVSIVLTLTNPSPGTIGVHRSTTVTVIDNDPGKLNVRGYQVLASKHVC